MNKEIPELLKSPEQPAFKDVIARMTALAYQIDRAESQEQREALKKEHEATIAEFNRIQADIDKINEMMHSGFSGPVAEA